MASNQDIKKPQRKADEDLPERLCERGKKPHQKFKPYIVLQYLLKYTDEDNTATAFDIIAFLKEYGLDSDRRSIYKDINEINSVYWMLENDVEIDEAIDTIKADKEGEEWKSIIEYYSISSEGRVKSFYNYYAIIIKPQKTEKGYLKVQIYNGDGTKANKFVHILVATAFEECGRPESDSWQVHHLNEKPNDNRKCNLKWVSAEEHIKLHNIAFRKEQ